MAWRDRRNRGRPGLGALVSAGVHLLLIGGVWALGVRADPIPPMRVYAVDIVSPPPVEEGPVEDGGPAAEPDAEPEPEVEAEPEPVAEPDPPPQPTREPEPRPTPPEPRPAPEERRAERAPEPAPEPERPARGPDPRPDSPGGEDLRIRTEGVACPSQAYCDNMNRVITHTWRQLRPAEARAERAEVFFYIERDGSVSGLRFVTRSGNRAFDLSAMEAVERAGRNRLFGSLPDGFGANRLPVIAPFSPEMLR